MNLQLLLSLLRATLLSVTSRPITLRRGETAVRVRFSGRSDGPLLLICPGFGASSADYEPLAEVFGEHYRVGRLAHPGSDRWAALKQLPRYLFWRWRHGAQQAALKARAVFHSERVRRSRLEQLRLAVEELAPAALAGHSFGTDTVLLAARELPLCDLYLFSPHPPGYLIGPQDYATLQSQRCLVVSGTQDRTPDGVGPEQRMSAVRAIPGARPLLLTGVAHMDFAFQGWGPPGWTAQLRSVVEEAAVSGERCLQAPDR